jgi:hypothetical protein
MPEIIRGIEQGSDAWGLERAGSVGGAGINCVLAKGQGKSRQSLLYRLAGEILADGPIPSYSNGYMERGHEHEPEARALYEFMHDCTVEQVSLIRADIPGVHVSPDGLVGDDGGIEIKTMMPHIYVELIDTGKIDLAYIRQCQMFLWVTKRAWIDFIAYCPEITTRPMWVKRITPDPGIQAQIETELPVFLRELGKLVERVRG